MRRIAIIGSGYFSQFQIAAWQRLVRQAPEPIEIIGLYGKDLASAQAMCQRFGIETCFTSLQELLSAAPDLIDLIVPPEAQFELIRTIAKRGIPIICQKPFCSDVEQAGLAAEFCELHKVPLVVHENFRHQPWYRVIRQWLEAGKLGPLYQLSFRIRPGDGQGEDAYLARQPYFRQQPRFLVRETAVHWIDVFRFLGGEIDEVFASLERLNPVIQGEDAGIILFRFKSGLRGLLDGNRLSDHAAANPRLTMGEMLIEGEKGVMTLNGDGVITFRPHASAIAQNIAFDWDDIDFAGDCVYLTQRHILQSIFQYHKLLQSGQGDQADERGLLPENTAMHYLINRQLEASIYQSSEEQRWVRPLAT